MPVVFCPQGIRPALSKRGGTHYFNQSGRAIVCPILKKTAPGPLHIQLRETEMEGYVLCEQIRYLDPTARRFSRLSATRYFDIMDISDAVVGMFERL